MGRGRLRNSGLIVAMILALMNPTRSAQAARSDGKDQDRPHRLTVEISWSWPKLPELPEGPPPGNPAVMLESTAGRILEVVPVPGPGATEPADAGAWRLGFGATGKVRARIEAPLSANLLVRAGNHATTFPVAALIETPQQSLPGSPIALNLRRLSWDALEISLGAPAEDGVVAPGAALPVTVGFNLLTPEPAEGVVRLIGELRPARGGEPVWRCDQSHRVASNLDPGRPAVVTPTLRTPSEEGSYVLEFRSYWTPVPVQEGTRIGRLIRRRRAPEPIQAFRRVTLAVVAPADTAKPRSGSKDIEDGKVSTIVDSLDVSRAKGNRPMAAGRSAVSEPWPVPDEALVRASDLGVGGRLRGLVGLGPDSALLGPPDNSGLAWVGISLRVVHPGRPHRLTITLAAGDPQALGVAMLATGEHAPSRPARILLDSVMSGTPTTAGAKAPSGTWLVWPDCLDPVLVLVHRGPGGPIRLGTVVLEELADELPRAIINSPLAASGTRRLGLVISSHRDLDRFGGAADPIATGRRLAGYLDHCGATVAVLPASLGTRPFRRALDGQAEEDATGPDRLALILQALATRNQSALLELDFESPLPGLPDPSAPEALMLGLTRIDGQGRPAGDQEGGTPTYNLLAPEVRAALKALAVDAIARRKDQSNVLGLLIRLGNGPTLAGSPDTGLDDATFNRFITAMLDPETSRKAPGRDPADPERFAVRRQYVLGPGRIPWLAWRARRIATLYPELAAAIEGAATGAILAVATPTLDAGPAGDEARRVDALGESPSNAWRAVGLDLSQWPAAPANLLVLRGVAQGTDPLARDLAAHADLDAPLLRREARGLIWNEPDPIDRKNGETESPTLRGGLPLIDDDEPIGHAIAALDASWLLISAAIAAGREPRLAQAARAIRALPATAPAHTAPRPESGIAARAWHVDSQTLVCLANDTPYPVRIDATIKMPAKAAIEDLGHGVAVPSMSAATDRKLPLDLPPFGLITLRINAPNAGLDAIVPYPPEDLISAQYRLLSTRLSRLSQGHSGGGLPNPGFEPVPAETGVVRTANAARVPGWFASEGAFIAIDPKRPHGGSGSLRIEGRDAAATASSDVFAPPGGSMLELRFWFRAEPPDSRVAVRFEGEAEGQAIVRRAEITSKVDWTEQRIRVSNLPPGGLDRLRLRFELMAPGQLWIDDLNLLGQRLSDPDRRAQRTLTAAVQKFREKRYADFARLANSYWSHTAATEPIRTGATDPSRDRRIR